MTEAKHEYPDKYPPGAHWAIDEAWEVLDHVTPGVLSIEARSLLAGMIAAKLIRERENASELERLFEMQRAADQRAVKRWRDAHQDRVRVLPDRTDMVVWLMEELDRHDYTT